MREEEIFNLIKKKRDDIVIPDIKPVVAAEI